MAINVNPGSPLRHVATFNSSGTFLAPPNSNVAFVSIHGASGGGAGSVGAPNGNGGYGGVGVIAGAYVQLTPAGNHTVTIGAGGAGGNSGTMPSVGGAGGTGGSTIFDGGFTGIGGSGGTNARYGGSAGSAGTATGFTTLTTVNPGASTLVRTGTITSQNTGGATGGVGANSPGAGRYGPGAAGSAGNSGQIHIYI